VVTIGLAIIGAGPAGITAAVLAAELGVETALIDEQASPGGQIYRGIERSRSNSPLGPDYLAGRDLAAALRASRVAYRPNTTVWHMDPDGMLYLESNGRSDVLAARRILLATGAFERPVPIPGWTLPGVMGAGAAQILLSRPTSSRKAAPCWRDRGRSSTSSPRSSPAPARRLLRCSRRRQWRIISRQRGSSTASGQAAECWRKDWV
jgi:glycine/D-amino acid oxidase-like deaminating enzyme